MAPFSLKPLLRPWEVPSRCRSRRFHNSYRIKPQPRGFSEEGAGSPRAPPRPSKGTAAQPAQRSRVGLKPRPSLKEIWLVLTFIFRLDTRTAEL